MNYPQANGFGNMPQMQYNNPYQMLSAQNPMNNRVQNDRINWVQSEEEAKAYPLIPNSNVALIDGNKNILYLKSCDNMGMCTLRQFAITELAENTATAPETDMSGYVRRDEFEELKRLINDMGGNNEKSVSANDGQSNRQHGNSKN